MDVNVGDEFNMTPLMRYAAIGNVEKVKELLAQGADPNARPNGSPTALYYAMETYCTPEMVKVLLEAGANVNAHNPGAHTILMRALVNTNQEIIRILLEAGADVNAIYYSGCTRQVTSGVGFTALMVAGMRVDGVEIVPLLLAQGADPNIKDELGRTAWTRAMESESLEAANLLQEAMTNS